MQGTKYTPDGTYDTSITTQFEDEGANGALSTEGFDPTVATDGHADESDVDSNGNYWSFLRIDGECKSNSVTQEVIAFAMTGESVSGSNSGQSSSRYRYAWPQPTNISVFAAASQVPGEGEAAGYDVVLELSQAASVSASIAGSATVSQSLSIERESSSVTVGKVGLSSTFGAAGAVGSVLSAVGAFPGLDLDINVDTGGPNGVDSYDADVSSSYGLPGNMQSVYGNAVVADLRVASATSMQCSRCSR
ncbi:MAG: hypothetical protein AAGE92_17630 [Cyanobacteria bacterium P01_G01_bin.4]